MSAAVARDRMVDLQLARRGIHDPRVLEAFRTVPREAFLPEGLAEFAYEDSPLPIGDGQTISQPYIVALMTEALRLSPSDRVLEIGTGSGYAAAVLAEIVEEVWTVERHRELADRTTATLAENQNKMPAAALWLTNSVVQLFVISTYWSQDAFTLMLSMTSVMTLIPFFLVALYGFLLVRRGAGQAAQPGARTGDLLFGSLAVVYTAFLLYAAGTKFLVLSAILYGPGTALYFWTRREQNKQVFTPIGWGIFAVTVVLCIAGIHGLVTGTITI